MAAKVLDVLSHVIKAWHVALLAQAEVIKAWHVALEVWAGVGHLMLLGPLGCTTSTVLHNYLVNDFTAGVWGVCVLHAWLYASLCTRPVGGGLFCYCVAASGDASGVVEGIVVGCCDSWVGVVVTEKPTKKKTYKHK